MKSLSFIYLDLEDVIDLGGMNMELAVEDIENTFCLYEKHDCLAPDKIAMVWGEGNDDDMTYGRINAMPGYLGGKYNMAGIKWIGSYPDNPYRNDLPRATAIIILNDPTSKAPVAVMDGTIISAVRTGAVTGVAAKYLSKNDSKSIVLIGAGVQNRTQLKAVLISRPNISNIYIYDLNYKRSITFANEMSKEINKEIIPIKNPKKYVLESDILITATTAKEPIIDADWILPGLFYSHVGGYECTFEAVKKFDKLVVDSWGKVKHRNASTIAIMANQGNIMDEHIYAELGEIVNKKKQGRNKNESIYFNSVGMGIEDISIATRIYKTAIENNKGKKLKLWDKPKYI